MTATRMRRRIGTQARYEIELLLCRRRLPHAILFLVALTAPRCQLHSTASYPYCSPSPARGRVQSEGDDITQS